MFQIITWLRRIYLVLQDILVVVRQIAKNTEPPPLPVPTSIRWIVQSPQQEE